MKITVQVEYDLLDDDPNKIGEFLRSVAFEDDGDEFFFGGYTTTVPNPDWAVHDKNSNYHKEFCLRNYGDEYGIHPHDVENAMVWSHYFDTSEGQITVTAGLLWDGDGMLVFEFWKGAELIHAIANWDCKKDYRWEVV